MQKLYEKKKVKKTFIVGCEESYGVLVGDFVRDKDAIIGGVLFAEITAWAKSQNKSVYDILLEIYEKYGKYVQKLENIFKEGKKGADEIQTIMKNYREETPKEIEGKKVIEMKDYSKQEAINLETGKIYKLELDKSNVIQFILEGETTLTVRPSGTEPKIKYYWEWKE